MQNQALGNSQQYAMTLSDWAPLKIFFWNLFESVGTHVFCGNFSSFYGNNVKCYT